MRRLLLRPWLLAVIGALLGFLAAVAYSTGRGGGETSDAIVVLGILGVLIGATLGGAVGSLFTEPSGDQADLRSWMRESRRHAGDSGSWMPVRSWMRETEARSGPAQPRRAAPTSTKARSSA